MSWPEYLQGYAGLGILQTLSSLIRAVRVAGGGEQMHLSIEGRKQEEGGPHRGDKFKGNTAFIYLPKSFGQLIASPGDPGWFQAQTQRCLSHFPSPKHALNKHIIHFLC